MEVRIQRLMWNVFGYNNVEQIRKNREQIKIIAKYL